MEETKRGSFTIPANEMEALKNLPNKFKTIAPALNKSEIIRVGIHQVGQLDSDTVNRILTAELGRLTVGKPSPTNDDVPLKPPDLKITEKQWRRLHPIFLDEKESRGRPAHDNRKVLDTILFIFRGKIQQRTVPMHLVSYSTAMRRLKLWKTTGLWVRACRILTDSPIPESIRRDFNAILLRTLLYDTGNRNIP